MTSFPLLLEKRLQDVRDLDCSRTLRQRQGLDFCSNDYLGFSNDRVLRDALLKKFTDVSLGSTGSRLIRGHHPIFDNAEQELAEFCGRESALIYASGYQANV